MAETNKDLFGQVSSGGKLSGRYRQNWVEESFYFEKSFGKQEAVVATTREYLGNNFTARKLKFLTIFLALIFSLIGLRLFYLQIIKGSEERQLAENNRQRIVPIPAERGLIYDRNGLLLTRNIPNFSLTLIPQSLPKNETEREKIIVRLAVMTGTPAEEIRAFLEEYRSYTYESIVIKENLDYDTALSILIALGDLPGIQIQRGSKRFYLNSGQEEFTTSTPSSLSHLIGYIGKLSKEELKNLYLQGYYPADTIGKTGIEKSYELLLRGTYGRRRIEVDATGKEAAVLAEEAPVPGAYLELNIDQKMQNKLETILQHYLVGSGKSRAGAVAMDSNNGEVLALVSLPTFDNNDFSGGISKEKYQAYANDKDNPLFNRVIGGVYPSGSTIKPVIAAGGLAEGIISPVTSFLSTGGLQVGDHFFPDWLAGGQGITNVRKALAWSVNTFFYYLGGGYNSFVGLGVDKIVFYLKKFGFSQKTDIDLPGEEFGFLPSREWKSAKGEKWYIGDTYNISIGQGDILVTPLQIANMTAAVANGGTLYQPQILKTVINPLTNERQEVKPEVIRTNFISADSLNVVRLGMRDCVVYGSCSRLGGLPIAVAGKTGTAQWNSNKPNHAWFTSFAPFDKPQIVVTVLVEEGGEGSVISASIANDFYKWWWAYYNGLVSN